MVTIDLNSFKPSHVGFFFVITLFIHVVDAFTGFNRGGSFLFLYGLIYLIIALYASLIVFRPVQENLLLSLKNRLPAALIPSLIAWGIPSLYLVIKLFIPSFSPSSLYYLLVLLTPAWPITLLYMTDVSSNIWLKRIGNIYLVVWIIIGLMYFIQNMGDTTVAAIGPLGNPAQAIGTFSKSVGKAAVATVAYVATIPQKLSEGWSDSVAYATGDYYTGQVEKSQNEALGVYLEDLDLSDDSYVEGDDVTVWGKIKAMTLDDDNPIEIEVSCYAISSEGDMVSGKIDDKEIQKFDLFSYEEEYIGCKIEDLSAGYHDITISANFTFETMAYLKTFFMDQDTIRAVRSQDKDVFTEYTVLERNPIAIYSPGPMMIGIESNSPPIGISDGGNPPMFGITLDNNWDGKITDLKEVTLRTPGFGIKGCDHDFSEAGSEGGYNVYSLDEEEINKIGDIDLFKSFRCSLDIGMDDLDSSPVTIRYLKASAEYEYSLEKTINVNIDEIQEEEI